MVDRKLLIGAALATGALLLVPGVAATVARTARPLVKAAVKRGLEAFEEVRHGAAEAFEELEDVAAEAKAEHEAAKAAGHEAAEAEPSSAAV